MSEQAPHPVGLHPPTRVQDPPAAVPFHDGRALNPTAFLNAAAVVLFSLTVFFSAALLFVVQPMFAKMALPLLGGTPAVWATCMVFFQAVLLVGYGYAHAVSGALGLRRQAAVHVALLLIALVSLPVTIPEHWSLAPQHSPVMWLLGLLLVALGLPFLVVSTTAPLVQKWFAGSGHPSGHDPYFLYAASNVGSLAALLTYPTLIEPNLRLADQSRLWALGYILLIGLLLACATVVWRSGASIATHEPATDGPAVVAVGGSAVLEPIDAARRARWVSLAFVPSSLMLGVTTYLTTDVAPMPLLWVVPLALYLLTFVLAFGRSARVSHHRAHRLLPILVLPLVMTIAFGAVGPLWVFAPLHLLAFFLISIVCHGELAGSRPSANQLTDFFLWVAVGGVLGGIFNALVAPLVFNRLIEYPLVLVVACMLQGPHATTRPGAAARWALAGPLAVAAVIVGLFWLVNAIGIVGLPGLLLVGGGPAVLCFALRHRPVAFGLALGALMVTTTLLREDAGHRTVYRERSFFGVWEVRVYPTDGFTVLLNGTTEHGRQSLEPSRAREPLSYFHRTGPIGQVFKALPPATARAGVGVIGLGTGSLACHGRRGQEFTFYEIDPAVLRIARNPRYFTFLEACPPAIRVVLGDARRSLAAAPDGHFGLFILDAFSSDAIPSHLLTREALRLYLEKLASSGVLAFHISNRHLDLEPTVGNLAHDARLLALAQLEGVASKDDAARVGKTSSHWVVLARRPEDFGTLRDDPRWRSLSPRPDRGLWTDDFSNMLEVMKWR